MGNRLSTEVFSTEMRKDKEGMFMTLEHKKDCVEMTLTNNINDETIQHATPVDAEAKFLANALEVSNIVMENYIRELFFI